MIADFNNREWGDLEDIVSKHVLTGKELSYLAAQYSTSTTSSSMN